ncbi:uncharacterized protein VDAG_05681 [Verticillium dahliae VdLs.17]|uniref:Uncharacterized protein n=1 Tax=Verticillium dahliae (strain VdLs.17 / ATCC MYA-4575 / FGSC 10137) TaxID=498257 RepID=G2X699_VERDV|nr:uncharacterized protein VDAG_05681 [Verticillium dahliae VdLs.17]EGY14517.1 hypothetical protein VDAG_05681 [Verticillium dahliae VdLs.17]
MLACYATSVLANSHHWGVCARKIKVDYSGRLDRPSSTPITTGEQLDVATKAACSDLQLQNAGMRDKVPATHLQDILGAKSGIIGVWFTKTRTQLALLKVRS